MDREQQRHRIGLVRRGIIAGSVIGSLGVAGYLGLEATATSENTATSTDSSTDTSTDSSTDSGTTTQLGLDQSQLSAGTGSAHATTSGS